MISTTRRYGKDLVLPEEIRERHGLTPEVSVRIVETRTGILLVPLTGEPMSAELQAELEEWQSLGAATWEMFPYDEDEVV